MKATLEFDILEERSELEQALNGWRYSLALWELDQYLRGIVKYGNKDMEGMSYSDTAQAIRERLSELMEENKISLD